MASSLSPSPSPTLPIPSGPTPTSSSNTGSSSLIPPSPSPSNSSSSSSSSSTTPSSTSSNTSSTSPSSSSSSTDSSTSPITPSSSTPATTSSPTNSSSSPPVSPTDNSTSSSAAPSTVVKTVTDSNGQVFTSTSTSFLPGPTGAADSQSDTSKSASHTGAIVGGVVGGVVALLLLALGILLYLRHRRRLEEEAFDGNFDPDRIIRPASGPGTPRGRGPTLPNIPLTDSDERLGPQMSELDDDGMGGRLNSATIGAGVVSPYPLYIPTSSPLRSATSPPPSAGHSSDAQHSMYGGQMADWRGPSPGPSIPTQYTGGSANSPPSSYPPSMNMAHLPPGAAPGPGGPGIPATAYAAAGVVGGRHSRRPSAGTSSSRERQPIYSDNGSSSAGSGDIHNGGRFGIANPDEVMMQNRNFNESARRAYIAGGPSSKSPTGPPQVPPREVLVHQDGGRIENNDNSRESESPEEIPPTYDSLLDAAGITSRSMPEKRNRS